MPPVLGLCAFGKGGYRRLKVCVYVDLDEIFPSERLNVASVDFRNPLPSREQYRPRTNWRLAPPGSLIYTVSSRLFLTWYG